MTANDKMSPEQMAVLRAELVAWEMREAGIYREPMTTQQASAKVDRGLARG